MGRDVRNAWADIVHIFPLLVADVVTLLANEHPVWYGMIHMNGRTYISTPTDSIFSPRVGTHVLSNCTCISNSLPYKAGIYKARQECYVDLLNHNGDMEVSALNSLEGEYLI